MNILIVGPSGSGKSTSIRTLPTDKTRVLNIERKPLPFPPKHPECISISSWAEFRSELKRAQEDQEKGILDITVVESFTAMTEMFSVQLKLDGVKGFDFWALYAEKIWEVIQEGKDFMGWLVWLGIDDVVELNNKVRLALKVQGKLLKGSLEKEFATVLFTETVEEPEGGIGYRFRTQTDGMCSAKSPMGMFKDLLIPNDLALVIKRMSEYYEIKGGPF